MMPTIPEAADYIARAAADSPKRYLVEAVKSGTKGFVREDLYQKAKVIDNIAKAPGDAVVIKRIVNGKAELRVLSDSIIWLDVMHIFLK